MTLVLLGFIVLVALYAFVAAFVCCEMSDEKPRWWCPACLLFGKRRTP